MIDLLDPRDEVLIQGEIARYKACINPGFQAPRWLTVTEKAIRYFRNQCNSIVSSSKPLLAVPLIAVERVALVDLPLAINEKNPEQARYL